MNVLLTMLPVSDIPRIFILRCVKIHVHMYFIVNRSLFAPRGVTKRLKRLSHEMNIF
jgi:hypothetical protein